MSELIAEARVLVTPDTTKFRSLLEAEVSAASKGVAVTVPVTPVVTAGGAAGQAAQTASKEAAAAEAAIAKVAQAETVLAAADAKIVTASTQASAARSQFTAATRASLVAQQAYAKALASEDEDVIAAAAATRTLTKDKQALALATLRAAQATAAEGAAQSRSAAATAEVAGATAARSAVKQVSVTSTEAAAANNLLARSAEVVAVAQRRAAAAGSEVGAAQTLYRAQVTATTLAFRAYQEALATNDLLLRQTARNTYAAAKANEAQALSALETARAEAAKTSALSKGATAQAASLGQLSRGAGATTLALTGLRGATLAATGPFLVGAAGAVAFGKAIGIATGFNQQLSVFAATTGATADEMERVSVAAQQLGKDLTLPGVSAGDAAEAMTEFAKAGLSVNDAITATRGGLQLATAAQLSNADAVELTASALNAFKLSGDQAVSVADTLANAANAAQGSIADIGLGLKQAAGAAAVVGVSFQDTTALLTLLAKNGLTASDAGTSLRTAFIRLVNPSKQAQKILTDLNVQLRDAQGNVRPEVFAEFANAQRNLAVSTQQANAAIVFGQDAFRAFGVLSREGAAGLQEARVELDKTGTAAKVAGARMVGVAGATANLKNQLEALGLTVGEVTSGPLAKLLNELATYATAAQTATVQTVGLAKSIAGVAESVPAGGFLIDVSKTAFKFGNIVGQINTAKNLLNRGGSDTAKEAEKTGVEIRDAIEQAGREASRGAVSFADQITGALNQAFSVVNQAIAQARQNARSAAIQAVGRGGGQQAGLEEQFNQILAAGGSPQAQIANLRQQAARQAKIIAEAGPDAAGVLLESRRAAQAKLATINQQIVSIEKGIAADQKAANDEVQRVRDDAKRARDQAFLQTQEDARAQAERRITQASDTPQLTDDIRRQEQLRGLIRKQIAALKASALDEQAKQSALRELRKARDATTDEIKRLIATDRQQRAEQRQQALEEGLQANIDLGQSILDLTGNKDPLLRAIAAEIKHQISLRNAAKKGSVEAKNAQTEINKLLLQRRELNKAAQDAARDAQGFSGFEFLQKTQGFASNLLGNLIPGFATGGLVGNVQTAQPQQPIDGVTTQFARPGDRGVRPVQVDTTNALLRQILAAVSGRHTNPPEIRQNRFTSDAVMDTL